MLLRVTTLELSTSAPHSNEQGHGSHSREEVVDGDGDLLEVVDVVVFEATVCEETWVAVVITHASVGTYSIYVGYLAINYVHMY